MVQRLEHLKQSNGSTNSFKLTQLSGGVMYSTTYAVRVAVKYGSGVLGVIMVLHVM